MACVVNYCETAVEEIKNSFNFEWWMGLEHVTGQQMFY